MYCINTANDDTVDTNAETADQYFTPGNNNAEGKCDTSDKSRCLAPSE